MATPTNRYTHTFFSGLESRLFLALPTVEILIIGLLAAAAAGEI